MLQNARALLTGLRPAPDPAARGLPEPALNQTTYIASAIINLLGLALPLTVLQIYDRVLPNAAYNTLSALILMLVGVVIIDGLLKYFRATVINWAAASYTHRLTTKALASMLATRPSKFNRTTASEHLERLNAISGLGGFIGGQSRIVAVDVFFIPIFASVIILIGGWVFCVVLALFAGFGYLAARRTRSLNSAVAEREAHESRKQDFLIEVLRSMQTIKSTAMEPLMMRRFERLQSAASVITQKIIKLSSTAQAYNAIYASLSVIAIVGVGALMVLDGRLTLGALACCMLLSSQLLQPLLRSLTSLNDIQLANHRRERIELLFNSCDSEIIHQRKLPHRITPKSITFETATIQHENAKPIFSNLSFKINAGEIVALKGDDGSGRSSLLRSIMGDTPVTSGSVYLGADAISSDIGSENVRKSVRYVGQNPTLFRGSILENLTMFGEYSTKTALTASRIVGLDTEVVRMPLGYDTLLKSAAGRDIPSPTAQRICIARAIAAHPSVLILDEANTLLDLAGEQRLVEALMRLRGRITIIISTHRPSLIKLADTAFEVQHGSIAPIFGNAPQLRTHAS